MFNNSNIFGSGIIHIFWGRWGDQLETKDAGEETMERNNWANQNSQRVVELKEEIEWKELKHTSERREMHTEFLPEKVKKAIHAQWHVWKNYI